MWKFIKKIFGRGLLVVGLQLQRIGKCIYQSPSELYGQAWFRDEIAEDRRFNFPTLTSDSIVLDLGGYQGQWASDIFGRYQAHIHVFEPIEKFHNYIEARFKQNPKIETYKFGLAEKNCRLACALDENASSVYGTSGKALTENIQLRDINEWFAEESIKEVALIKINIEGGEFALLDRMIECDLINRFENILVQFHHFVPNAEIWRTSIQAKLANTHRLKFDYPFVWEHWERF